MRRLLPPMLCMLCMLCVLCAAALAACGGAAGSSTAPATVGSPPGGTPHRMGEPVRIGDLVVTVNGVSEPVGGQADRPQAGQKFLAVDLTLENTGGAPTDISTVVMMSLRDTAGHVYRPNVMATNVATGSQDTMDGPLVPTQPLRGKVGFQVPVAAHSLVFQFQPTLNGPITAFALQQ